jgi:hypothetical protein
MVDAVGWTIEVRILSQKWHGPRLEIWRAIYASPEEAIAAVKAKVRPRDDLSISIVSSLSANDVAHMGLASGEVTR